MALRLIRLRQPSRRGFLRRQMVLTLAAVLFWLCAILATGYAALPGENEVYHAIILTGLFVPIAILVVATGLQRFRDKISSGDGL